MTPEKRVQNAIVTYLSKLRQQGEPILVERRQAGGFSYKKGLPDLYVVYNGLHIEIEVKRVGGHQSPMQEKWEDRFEKLGIPYILADSVDDVKNFFEEFLK